MNIKIMLGYIIFCLILKDKKTFFLTNVINYHQYLFNFMYFN